MIVLVADDVATNRKLLRVSLETEGYDVVEVHDGRDALDVFRESAVPVIGLIDWEMPGLDGLEVCRGVREMAGAAPAFLILVTVRCGRSDIAAAFEAGVHDYAVKPVNLAPLMARVRTAARLLSLQQDFLDRGRQLEKARADIRTLRSLLPVCASCEKIRDDPEYRRQLQDYLSFQPPLGAGLGICPACLGAQAVPSAAPIRTKKESI